MITSNTAGVSPASSLLRYAVIALALAFPSVCLLVNRGDSIGLGLLALLGFWVGFREGFAHILKREDWYVALAFFAFFAVAVLSYEVGQETYAGFRFLGRDLRFLFIVPVLAAFRRYPPSIKTVFIGLAIGGLLTGVYALVEFVHASAMFQVQAQTDLPIMFGDLTASITLTLAAAYGLVVTPRKWWLTVAFLLCVLFGLMAVIFSGARGAWVALLLLLPLLFGLLSRATHKRYLALIVVSLFVLFAGAYAFSRTDLRTRLYQIAEGISLYQTALHLLPWDRGQVSKNTSLCDDQYSFLESWLAMSVQDGGDILAAKVVLDPTPATGEQIDTRCHHGYVIHIWNSGKINGRLVFQRMVIGNHIPQSTRLIVRGTGTIFLSGKDAQTLHVNTNLYQMIVLHSPSESGHELAIIVEPGQAVWLVPVEGYFGEYRYVLTNTTVGQRFEMWRAAWHMFLEHPLLGVGTGAYYEGAQQMAHRGLIAPSAAQYDHPHSDYFDALSSRGIIGFAALLALLLVPGIYFRRALKSPEDTSHAVGLAGLLLVCGFAIFGLTDTVFIHSMNISWYVIYVALFMALLSQGHTR